jgi:hypothetical protein
MGGKKAILLKYDYFHAQTCLLQQKIYADSKNDLKSSKQYEKGLNFSIELSREMTIQICKTVWEKLA